ncbi:TspO/MBR family protein [Winogradskyella litorisediminis]|uniref:TspO/MBR family protein n=1 Tax=Winogradskyella litorisediminis TaxID=1156618 RepID=A0ABW3NAC1_9FLAO
MKKIYYFIIFLIINFGGLGLGMLFMGDGPGSDWYLNLNRAPWEPQGWVFGAAWTLIMLCFSWYLAELFHLRKSPFIISLFIIQFVLNVSWNWFFFNLHYTLIALVVISLLTLLLLYFFLTFRNERLKVAKYLLLPYIIWLCIATSLNAYIVLYN